MVLFSRPIARNMSGYAEAKMLYQNALAYDQRHCPFWILVAMCQRGSVDFRAHFDDEHRLRGLSLCVSDRGVAFVPLIVAYADYSANEATYQASIKSASQATDQLTDQSARKSVPSGAMHNQGFDTVAQILGWLECRYQGMSLLVSSEGVATVTRSGAMPRNGLEVLRGEGFTNTDLAVRRGNTEFPVLQKGRVISEEAWEQAYRHMPASVMPAVVAADASGVARTSRRQIA